MAGKPKSYKVGNETLVLKPITLGQIKKISELLLDIDVDREKPIKEFITLLLDQKANALLAIIFPDATAVAWDEVDYETIDEIVTDFFEVNPRLKNRLQNLFGNLARIAEPPTN